MASDKLLLQIGDAPEIEAYLSERIYEFNSKATGYFDGESFSATQRDASEVIQAGIYGYTWGGCCYITYLWVEEAQRGKGIGAALPRCGRRTCQKEGLQSDVARHAQLSGPRLL
jgi:GNAT superfamily N-acetyltransferase